MLAEERKARIVEYLQLQETASVQELSERLKVSEMTIRRDLLELDKKNLIRRVHGGATILQAVTIRTPFKERGDRLLKEKLQIAKKTADLIQDGETILLDIGTTTYLVSKLLKDKKNLLVITNSLNIATELAGQANLKVMLLGGYVHDESELSVIGSSAIKMLANLRVDKAVIGVAGITEDRGIVNLGLEESEIRRAMIECSRQVIVVADHSKMGRDSLISVAPLSSVHTVITDGASTEDDLKMLRNHGIEVIIA